MEIFEIVRPFVILVRIAWVQEWKHPADYIGEYQHRFKKLIARRIFAFVAGLRIHGWR